MRVISKQVIFRFLPNLRRLNKITKICRDLLNCLENTCTHYLYLTYKTVL